MTFSTVWFETFRTVYDVGYEHLALFTFLELQTSITLIVHIPHTLRVAYDTVTNILRSPCFTWFTFVSRVPTHRTISVTNNADAAVVV